MSRPRYGGVPDLISFRLPRRVNDMVLTLAKEEKRTKIAEMQFLAEKRLEELGIKKIVDSRKMAVTKTPIAELPLSK
jgi:hypothetical protein